MSLKIQFTLPLLTFPQASQAANCIKRSKIPSWYMPDWLFANHLKRTTQSMEAFNRTALPISRLLTDPDILYSCEVTPRTTLLRSGFQRPPNAYLSTLLITISYFEALQEVQFSTQESDLVNFRGSLQPGTLRKCIDYVQTGKHRSRGGQLIHWRS